MISCITRTMIQSLGGHKLKFYHFSLLSPSIYYTYTERMKKMGRPGPLLMSLFPALIRGHTKIIIKWSPIINRNGIKWDMEYENWKWFCYVYSTIKYNFVKGYKLLATFIVSKTLKISYETANLDCIALEFPNIHFLEDQLRVAIPDTWGWLAVKVAE